MAVPSLRHGPQACISEARTRSRSQWLIIRQGEGIGGRWIEIAVRIASSRFAYHSHPLLAVVIESAEYGRSLYRYREHLDRPYPNLRTTSSPSLSPSILRQLQCHLYLSFAVVFSSPSPSKLHCRHVHPHPIPELFAIGKNEISGLQRWICPDSHLLKTAGPGQELF